MKRNVLIKMTSCGLAAILAVGGVAVGTEASPIAGLSTYTSNIVTSSVLPTAGISLAMNECVAAVEDEATVASAEPKVKENDTPVVASEYADLAVATVDDYVNVRKKASTDSEVVGKLYKNNVGTVIETKGDWYKIKSGSVTGYVKSEFVAVNNEKLAKKAGRRIAVVTTETLKVRKGASAKAEVITLVPGGEDLTVIDESVEGWVGVSVDEGDGYVSADYVELSTEYTYAESREEEKARLKKEEEERKAAEEAARKEEEKKKASSSSSSSSSSSGSSSSSSSSSSSYDAPSGTSGSSVANFACQFVGRPYVYGGTSLTNGADCSGFVMSVYKEFGVSLPHSSSAMRSVGYGVSASEMQPGDIVCYSGHVAIYVGNNTIVHASNRRDGIKLTSPANYRTILAVRRIF